MEEEARRKILADQLDRRVTGDLEHIKSLVACLGPHCSPEDLDRLIRRVEARPGVKNPRGLIVKLIESGDWRRELTFRDGEEDRPPGVEGFQGLPPVPEMSEEERAELIELGRAKVRAWRADTRLLRSMRRLTPLSSRSEPNRPWISGDAWSGNDARKRSDSESGSGGS